MTYLGFRLWRYIVAGGLGLDIEDKLGKYLY